MWTLHWPNAVPEVVKPDQIKAYATATRMHAPPWYCKVGIRRKGIYMHGDVPSPSVSNQRHLSTTEFAKWAMGHLVSATGLHRRLKLLFVTFVFFIGSNKTFQNEMITENLGSTSTHTDSAATCWWRAPYKTSWTPRKGTASARWAVRSYQYGSQLQWCSWMNMRLGAAPI